MSAEAIQETNRQFEEAARRGDADGMAAVYTREGSALPPDGPIVTGREALTSLWGSVLDGMGLQDVSLETLDLEVDGDTACEVGRATLELNPPGSEPTSLAVKFVVFWRKEDGVWKWHRDIWNAMPAAASAAS